MKRYLFFILLLLSLVTVSYAQDGPPLAEISNDEGGVAVITGVLPITNPFIKIATVEAFILLEDQGGFVARDYDFVFPPESQIIGRFTSDFFAEEPVSYELDLPIIPQGTQHDVDHDGETDAGVQIYQVGYWDNYYGDIYLDDRDGTGWSTAYSSARVSENPKNLGEYLGGRILIYAPDDQQGFPAGFGEDGKLFTEDDPIVIVPRGYTMVDMDTDPFTFDRSASVTMDLYEPESFELDDFSELSYTEAFDALIEKAKREYPFTELKELDWDALAELYRPRIQQAEADGNATDYLLAMDEFAKAIPDGHVSAASDVSNQFEQERIAGGLGLAVRELSDGRILVIFLTEGGPAQEAGIEYGAEIIAIDGVPIQDAILSAYSPNGPYSKPATERLDLVRFVTRFPLSKGEVEVTYKNPNADEETTVTLPVVGERESLSFTRQFVYGQTVFVPVPPLNWEFYANSNYGYVQVNDLFGNLELIVKNWELFLQTANELGSPAIIIDLRQNSGGFSGLSAWLTSYLIEEPIDLYYSEEYNPDIEAYFRDPRQEIELEPERDEAKRYNGQIVVLIGPGCASACEFFAYNLNLIDRVTIMGHYGTNGIAGGTQPVSMPEGIEFTLPIERSIDPEGNIIIENVGVDPDIFVPITEENMSSTDDLVLEAALAYLDEATAVEIVEGDAIAIGESLTMTIAPGQRVNHAFNTGDGGVVNIVMQSDIGAYVNILAPDGQVLASGTTPDDPGWEELELPPNFDLVLQVVTDGDDGEGEYTISIELTE